jgi:large conductance mechanosensitive channel
MSFIKEFKEFASKGNVVDLAVGIVIGAAFGKIVSSAVSDVIMPPLGLLIGGINFTDIKLILKDAVVNDSGKIVHQAVSLNVGNFIQTIFDFVIIAFSVFIVVKVMNRLKKNQEQKSTAPAEPSNQEKILSEIRDLLKK